MATSDGQLDGDLVLEGGGDVEFDIDDSDGTGTGSRSSGIRIAVKAGCWTMTPSPVSWKPTLISCPMPRTTRVSDPWRWRSAGSPCGLTGWATTVWIVATGGTGTGVSIVASARPKRSGDTRSDVGMHAARNFASWQDGWALRMNDPERGTVPPKARLRTISSKPLSESCRGHAVLPNNQLAETLARVVGKPDGHPRTLAQSAQIAAEIVTRAYRRRLERLFTWRITGIVTRDAGNTGAACGPAAATARPPRPARTAGNRAAGPEGNGALPATARRCVCLGEDRSLDFASALADISWPMTACACSSS
ncbi:MAG: hypothetical protein R3D03_14355 [Geminicoccaceae bacterium]